MPCMPEINNETRLKNPQPCFPTNMQSQIRSAGCLLSVTWRLAIYHVDVGRCMSDKQEFRYQMQGAHKAPFPGPAREFSCSRTYCGYQTAWNSTTLTEWLSKKGVYMAWLRRVLKYSYVPWTSAEMVDSCLAEPSSCCCNRSGIYPVRIEIRHSNISPAFHDQE